MPALPHTEQQEVAAWFVLGPDGLSRGERSTGTGHERPQPPQKLAPTLMGTIAHTKSNSHYYPVLRNSECPASLFCILFFPFRIVLLPGMVF